MVEDLFENRDELKNYLKINFIIYRRGAIYRALSLGAMNCTLTKIFQTILK